MARRTVTDEPIELGTDQAEEQLADLLSEVMGAQEPRVKIARRKPDHGLEYCGQLIVAPGFNLEEEVLSNFGGGKYTCQFYAKDEGETRLRPKGSITIQIAGEPRDPKAKEAPAAPAAGPSAELYDLKLQLAELKGMLAGMQQAGGRAETLDPVSMMEKLSNVLTNAGVRSGPVDPMESITKIIGAVKEVVGVGREIAPEEGSGVSWAPVIDKATTAITELVREAGAQRRQLPPGAGAAPVENPPPIALPEGTPMWQAEIAQWVPQLVARAAAGKNAELAAELLLEELTPGTVRTIQGLVEKDQNFVATVWGQLAGVFPDTKPYEEWFLALLEEIRAQLGPEEPPAPDLKVVH